jgi:alpha-L-fucosidase
MKNHHLSALTFIILCVMSSFVRGQKMDELWGDQVTKLCAADAKRGQLFDEGNYALFIHWGLYSLLANKVDGKTYYGIGEWIMNGRMANIPYQEYMKLAGDFNPVNFDAEAIAQLAKDAGMKYVIITAKHHDGFAMYGSEVDDFNIVDATPWGKDPMHELAAACRKRGLGFGFYYSHNQDWTFPGGGLGPKIDADGNPATFDDYFKRKCLPQVEELTSRYGPIELIWFDTPGGMEKKYVEQLVEVVRRNQPNALVSGRAGHGLGDYQTLGDMEIPDQNVSGMWESVDTTNDSWAYAWYDENWKAPQEILHRLVSCVARGGTYMLNIGPTGNGAVPERAARALREAGQWIQRYPQVVYATDASPWQRALPWGDVTVKGNHLFLSVFDWPDSGKLYLPGLKTPIQSAQLLADGERVDLPSERSGEWTIFQIPAKAPESLASVIELTLAGPPEVDPTIGLDPNGETRILAKFGKANKGVRISNQRWMEKFGEWKVAFPAHTWKPDGRLTFDVDVLAEGDYQVDLTYSGEGRIVWGVGIDGGESIQNQQGAAEVYHTYPIGWLNFPKPGRYTITVTCLEGNRNSAKLKALHLTPIE